jgi:hypothetical protein
VSGNVEYVGLRASAYWNFKLKNETGEVITCYEYNYHVEAWIMPDVAVKRAEREQEPLTVVGKLEGKSRLELDWIEYKGQHYNTDHKPVHIPYPFL